MRGRQNILAFNLPENNSDSPDLSRWQSVTLRQHHSPRPSAGAISAANHCAAGRGSPKMGLL